MKSATELFALHALHTIAMREYVLYEQTPVAQQWLFEQMIVDSVCDQRQERCFPLLYVDTAVGIKRSTVINLHSSTKYDMSSRRTIYKLRISGQHHFQDDGGLCIGVAILRETPT